MSRAKQKIHHKISVPAFKALIKNFEEVRYVIDIDGKLHAACADYAIHCDILDMNESDICGYANYKNGEFTHRPWYSDQGSKRLTHPLFTKFTEKGIKRVRKNYSFIW